LAGAAAEDAAARGDRLLDERLRLLSGGLVDQPADDRRLVERVPGPQLGDPLEQLLAQRLVDRRVRVQTLNRDARLARAQEPPERAPLRDVVEVGVRLDDHGAVAAELE